MRSEIAVAVAMRVVLYGMSVVVLTHIHASTHGSSYPS